MTGCDGQEPDNGRLLHLDPWGPGCYPGRSPRPPGEAWNRNGAVEAVGGHGTERYVCSTCGGISPSHRGAGWGRAPDAEVHDMTLTAGGQFDRLDPRPGRVDPRLGRPADAIGVVAETIEVLGGTQAIGAGVVAEAQAAG